MAGGVLAAIIGPELVKRTNMLVPPLAFLGTYICLTALPAIAAIPLVFIRLPPAVRATGTPVSIRTILSRPNFIAAVACSMVGYGAMNLVMASTPLEMMFCDSGIGSSADVIRGHCIAMFLPGFITGRLIQRYGVYRIIIAGGALTLLCVALNVGLMPGDGEFLAALMLLGIGWNFTFVGATTLLTTAHTPAERMRVQATNDFIVFATVACTAFTSGALEAGSGWISLNLTVVPAVLIAVVLTVCTGHHVRGWHQRPPDRPRPRGAAPDRYLSRLHRPALARRVLLRPKTIVISSSKRLDSLRAAAVTPDARAARRSSTRIGVRC